MLKQPLNTSSNVTPPIEVAAAVIVDRQGHILCVRRSEQADASVARRYEFAGGKIEPGETPADAAVREIAEELSITISPIKTLCVVTHTYPEKTIRLTAVLCGFECGTLTLTEHTDAQWRSIDTLSRLDWASADLAIVQRIQSDYFAGMLSDYGISDRYHLRLVRELDSTNTALIHLAETGVAHGTILMADAQTAGRGRLGRQWQATPGKNLLFSLLARSNLPVEELVTLPLLAGLAMTLALRNEALWPNRQQPGIKWPNDILFNDKKICGILCESQTSAIGIEGIIIGIGVNTSDVPPEMAYRGTSVQEATGEPCDRFKLLAFFCLTFDKLYHMWQRGGFKSICKQVNDCDIKQGLPITVKQVDHIIEGICEGIGEDGALLLRHPSGTVERIVCGEIHQWA